MVNRRSFLKRSTIGLTAISLGHWPGLAQTTALETSLKEKLGVGLTDLVESELLRLTMPDYAELATNVSVEIEVLLPVEQIQQLHFFADANPIPHVFSLGFVAAKVLPYVETRVRLAETAMARAVVETTDGRFLMASQLVEVGIGGCG